MKEDLINLRHARSRQDFPHLKLEDNEYVELAFKRSRIGIIGIWVGEVAALFILTVVFILFSFSTDMNSFFNLNDAARGYLTTLVISLYGVFFVVGLVATYVYNANEIFITNRRIIQNSVNSLFSKSTNVIDLISIEDVSFHQSGIIQYMFKIGTLRLATVGNETTYTFPYIDAPTDEISIITHLIHVEKDRRSYPVLQ